VQVSTHSTLNYPILPVADQVAQGKLKAGAAIVRSHGHHAEADAAMGFCLFNNVAVCTLRIIWSIDIWSVAPCIY
jgi:acetoin utilization deacetylase AcuC-like enzyme